MNRCLQVKEKQMPSQAHQQMTNRTRQQMPTRACQLFSNNLSTHGIPPSRVSPITPDDSTFDGSRSPSNDMLNDSTGDSPVPRQSNPKKRGASKGIGWVPGQKQLVLITNEYGQPVGPAKIIEAFQTRVGIIARRDIPVCYDDWRKVPSPIKQDAFECLSAQFRFDYQETIDFSYTMKRINEAWKSYKHELFGKHVKDKNLSLVKEGPPPDGIPIEDWQQFVDNCHSPKFKSSSITNSINCRKKKMPSCTGRKSAAMVRHEMAIERGVPDSEIGRSETFSVIHTKKDKSLQCPEIQETIENYISSDPRSQLTSTEDAVAKTLGPDSRGQFRGMGTGVCKTKVKMMDPFLKKNIALLEENLELKREMKNIGAKVDANMAETRSQMNELRSMFLSQGRTSSPSTHSSSSNTHTYNQADTVDNSNIGKECKLIGWPHRAVGKGIVEEVNPSVMIGQRILGDGNYKVYVNVICDPHALLPFPHDQFTTLGQVGQGSVIWPKQFLEL